MSRPMLRIQSGADVMLFGELIGAPREAKTPEDRMRLAYLWLGSFEEPEKCYGSINAAEILRMADIIRRRYVIEDCPDCQRALAGKGADRG